MRTARSIPGITDKMLKKIIVAKMVVWGNDPNNWDPAPPAPVPVVEEKEAPAPGPAIDPMAQAPIPGGLLSYDIIYYI